MRSRTTWTTVVCAAALGMCALAAVRAAEQDLRHSGMADPAALAAAFDRFAAAGPPADVVILSLANLRGISTESVNAGGRVRVDLAAGTVMSSAFLLPLADTFDLWLVDNRPGPGRSTLADLGDRLLKVGSYTVAAGRHTLSMSPGPSAFTG